MKDNREIKKASSIWRSRSFCVIATTLILWVWGDIAQPQATSCQVGTYDCAGSLYLSNGNVGIGTTNPRRGLHIENADPRILVFDTDAPISATRPAWEFGQSGSNFALRTTPDYSTFSGDVASITPEGNLAISGRITATGGYSQPGIGGETLRIIRGAINSNGTIDFGSGFSVVKNGAGDYTITFSTAFSGRPVVTATIGDKDGPGFPTPINVFAMQTGSCRVFTYNTSGTNADNFFQFIAVGPA